MSVPKVLGSRVLVKPDLPAETTASGLLLPSDRDHVPVSGEVVALGPDGSEVGYRARQEGIRDALLVIAEVESEWNFPASLQIARENVARLLRTKAEDDVAVGDRVVFPAEIGLTMTIDGEQYIVLNQDDCCVVVNEASEAA